MSLPFFSIYSALSVCSHQKSSGESSTARIQSFHAPTAVEIPFFGISAA
jgi:hypothetical protein